MLASHVRSQEFNPPQLQLPHFSPFLILEIFTDTLTLLKFFFFNVRYYLASHFWKDKLFEKAIEKAVCIFVVFSFLSDKCTRQTHTLTYLILRMSSAEKRNISGSDIQLDRTNVVGRGRSSIVFGGVFGATKVAIKRIMSTDIHPQWLNGSDDAVFDKISALKHENFLKLHGIYSDEHFR